MHQLRVGHPLSHVTLSFRPPEPYTRPRLPPHAQKVIFIRAAMSPECIIVALVYLNRAGLPLLPHTWRPCVLSSLMLAQKVGPLMGMG